MKQTKTHIISSSDGLSIAILVCEPNIEPKAIVQIAHGMAEHKERYIAFMSFLADHGYVCVINDHRGHGESVKVFDDLGYFYKGGAKALLNDTFEVSKWAKNRYNNIPLFLFGHSMGSLLVRAYARKYDYYINKLVICGSPSNNAFIWFGKLLTYFFSPHQRPEMLYKMVLGNKNRLFESERLPNAWLSANRDNVVKYNQDKYCGYKFTSNGCKSLFNLMNAAYSKHGWLVSRPNMPILFISGGKDPCMVDEDHFLKAVERIKKVGYTNVKYIVYPGLRHEILNENDINVFFDVLNFFDSTD
jgi:alpha-beta hydrolase superfamily lysophospholipase